MNYLLSAPKLDQLNWETVKDALTILWQGLLAIFVVIAIIIIVLKLVNFCIYLFTITFPRISQNWQEKKAKKAAEQANMQNDGEDAPQN